MAVKKISEFSKATNINDDDVLLIEQNGGGKSISIEDLFSYINGYEPLEHWKKSVISEIATGIDRSVCYGQGKFFVVGRTGDAFCSEDLINWTQIDLQKDIVSTIYSICYSKGLFVAVATVGTSKFEGFSPCFYSTDGSVWKIADCKFSGTYGTLFSYGMEVRFLVDRFFIVGNYRQISYSYDGINWTAISDAVTEDKISFRSITYGNGKFVVVGQKCSIWYSKDGLKWQEAEKPDTNDFDLYRIAFGNGIFVAVGTTMSIVYSYDGIHWNYVDKLYSGDYSSTIAFVKNRFIVVSLSGNIYTSADGINYEKISVIEDMDISNCCYAKNKLVLVGNSNNTKSAYICNL